MVVVLGSDPMYGLERIGSAIYCGICGGYDQVKLRASQDIYGEGVGNAE